MHPLRTSSIRSGTVPMQQSLSAPSLARKWQGRYYTPPELVRQALDSALVPVLDDCLGAAGTAEQHEAALLALRVCDPACGTGHFLLAAARSLALALVRCRHQAARCGAGAARASETALGAVAERRIGSCDDIPPDLYRPAVRDVLRSCIYGVDRDPEAVARCKTALSAECGGVPDVASLLDAHIKCGDSLVGFGPVQEQGTLDRRLESRLPARDYPFFHWPLEFPDALAAGGFDVVLANPPWEQMQPQEVEFFASHGRLDIAVLPGARRKAAIRALSRTDAALAAAWEEYKRSIEAQSRFIRTSGRFPLTAGGRLNTYAAFMETVRAILHPAGRAGCIVPSGLVTDDTTKRFFQDLVDSRTLVSLYHFDNRKKLFPAVCGNITFCLLTLRGSSDRLARDAEFAFFLQQVDDLYDPERRFRLTGRDITLLNPNTRTCPILRSRRDAELTKGVYRRVPVFVREVPSTENSWGMEFRQGQFNMTSVSHLFRAREELELDGWRLERNVFVRGRDRYLPLYEAKMLHQFDHRWATYAGGRPEDPPTDSRGRPVARSLRGRVPGARTSPEGTRFGGDGEPPDPASAVLPRYWVAEAEVERRVLPRWDRPWLLGWRLVCRSTDERTVIGTVLPRVGCGNSILVLFPQASSIAGYALGAAALVGCLNSFALDYIARQKLGGINLNFHILKQLPVPPPSLYKRPAPWTADEGLDRWLARRVLELIYSASDLRPFALDLGYGGPPFAWDADRRFHLRCQLDAAFFHLYGMTRPEAAHALDAFPSVKRKDEKRFGEYRTKRVILELYEAMTEPRAIGALGHPPAAAALPEARLPRPLSCPPDRP